MKYAYARVSTRKQSREVTGLKPKFPNFAQRDTMNLLSMNFPVQLQNVQILKDCLKNFTLAIP